MEANGGADKIREWIAPLLGDVGADEGEEDNEEQ